LFYVYEHIRPDTNKVFYVGKGSGNRCNTSRGRNKYWHNFVNKAGGFKIRKISESEDEEFVFFVEEERIDQLKKLGFELTNMTSGGEGLAGSKNPRFNYNSLRQKRLRGELKVPKEVMIANMKANHWSKTRSWNPKGIKKSEAGKKNMRGHRESVAGGNNPKAKVIIYDEKEFSCIKDFAKYLNVNYKTLVVKIREVGRTVFTKKDFDSLTNGKVKFN
jgi:hypothetical protein